MQIHVNEYPQLRTLCWNRPDNAVVDGQGALGLYENNWFLKQFVKYLTHLTLPEIKDFNALSDTLCLKLFAKRYSQDRKVRRKGAEVARYSCCAFRQRRIYA
jgi:hypothetical protein